MGGVVPSVVGTGWRVDGVVVDQVEDVEEVHALLLDVIVLADFLVHPLEAGSGLLAQPCPPV